MLLAIVNGESMVVWIWRQHNVQIVIALGLTDRPQTTNELLDQLV